MATTIPRPSRPSLNPPTGPLPSLPVPKSRKSTANVPTSPASSRAPSTSLLPTAASNRAVSSSALPTRPYKHHSNSTSNVPTLSTPQSPAGPAPGKILRKTISIGAFPQPPRSVGRNSSHPPSPLSASATPGEGIDNKLLAVAKSIPARESSLRRKSTRVSGIGTTLRSPLGSPSLINSSDKCVSPSTLLNLPSPPQSRTSSPQGSYATGTTFEDYGEDEARGRDGASADHGKSDKQTSQKDSKGNVIVSVRVRPDAGSNEGNKPELEWMVDGRRSLISYRGKEGGEYYYDNVFTTHDNNARVYDSAAKRLVRRVMEGYHGTVFAYGMTGTGKTFSMQGTATSPGVIPLAITDIFSFIRETPNREFLLRVSYLEIYNEKIHDLLSAPGVTANGQAAPQEEIKLREDSKRGVYATPLKEEIVQSPTQLLRVIARGDNARRTGSTQFNARSSRSHAVVQIVVESRERIPGSGSLHESKRAAIPPGGVRVSTLSLIDLAGSEKAAESKERRTEGAHINKSLLTLGTVIARLSTDKDKSGNVSDKDTKHLPYRDSKLTRLLQPALSGNSLVSILCTIQIGAAGSVAAAHSHTGETLNTLKFASRAKNNIVSHAKKAEEALGSSADAGSRALLDRYRMEITELRKQLETQNKANQDAKKEVEEEEEKAREREAEVRHEEQMLEMQLARTALKERIEHLNRLILSSKSLGVNANRSFSALSLQHRGSTISNNEFNTTSARSSTSHSHTTLEAPQRQSSSGSTAAPLTPPSTGSNGIPGDNHSEDDSIGENGDGSATAAVQIRALQADLADKNRYISTLEKRLLQARRSSHSRVSMSFANSHRLNGALGEDGGAESLLKEKDAEIADLRARLDDKDRMVSALRSAARKRDVADLSIDTSSTSERRTSSFHRSESSVASSFKATPVSPVGLLSPAIKERTRGVEEMTRILDEMISDRVESGQLIRSSRNSIRVPSESR
ncbi:kinesin-domain-containing protein [Patellaria atrata CBS 101060]|uniref:Kinesin-like protein n=1 Tax=Patellaria atrata CBS 101060 TaxID=1346257 RepID=A0A9P4SGY1_9PEZI|nr:kinesin-domain-containing protein [Patellaria atrata CBS 101060]